MTNIRNFVTLFNQFTATVNDVVEMIGVCTVETVYDAVVEEFTSDIVLKDSANCKADLLVAFPLVESIIQDAKTKDPSWPAHLLMLITDLNDIRLDC